ncbi:hypothetical protein BDZ89DRAFT_1127103 [Hymenopellis radicata]|nr:hypothetical protein BDZ89DRAFT_1127103 [Hymenopellis radicata]
MASREAGSFIENVRGKEDCVSLDKSGFQFYSNCPSQVSSFDSEEEVTKVYYPEVINYFKTLTGASRVVIFDHTIRRCRPGVADDSPDKRQPVLNAHVDQTPKSSVNRVKQNLPADEAEELLKKRFQVVNLWRPISHVATDPPLALCDYRSVNPSEDVVPIALIYPNMEGETYGVKYNPGYQWKYLRGMSTDEIILLKCFDSKPGVAPYTPHTAFIDPSAPADAPKRESIEVRALLFYDEE